MLVVLQLLENLQFFDIFVLLHPRLEIVHNLLLLSLQEFFRIQKLELEALLYL